MGDLSPGIPSTVRPPEDRLESWKEIAGYVKRDITTVQRWEKREGMPVHRHLHDKRGSVYAFSSELNEWLQSRRLGLEEEKEKERGAYTPFEVRNIEVRNEDRPEVRRRIRRSMVLGGVVGLTLIFVTYLVISNHERKLAPPGITSLAVMPLKNLSGDPTQDYFADGMTEELIGRLSLIRGLRVISRTSVMQFKETHMTAPEIGKALNVDALVEGSVVREGGRLRVYAQLIRTATDEHFWSQSYDRELRDVLALQSNLAQTIAERVEVTVTGQERARIVAVRPVSPDVYENYLKGRSILEQAYSRSEIDRSVGYFEAATQQDAAFAPAYVGLAESYDKLGTIFVGAPPAEVRPKVIRAARKALELNPDLADAHLLLADVYQTQWRWSEAEAEYKRALELKPNDANAHIGFAHWWLAHGRMEEAILWARRGRELDPYTVSGTNVGSTLFYARRYDEAMRELHSVLAVNQNDASALWHLGSALVANGQPADAIPVLEKAAVMTNRSPGVISELIRAYAHAGHRDDALRLLNELKRRRQAGYLPAGAMVNAYLGLDDRDQAFVWFEQAYQEQSNILQFLKVHPFFDPVRGDPRFKDLLHRVGLDQA